MATISILNFQLMRSFFHWVLLTLLLLNVPTLAAQNTGLLYKLEKPGHPVSYLFGSIHSGDPRVLAIAESMRSEIQSADQFIMEIKIDQSSVLQAMTGMWLNDGKKLQDVIGPGLYYEVVETGKSIGLPKQTFTFMKPWVVMMLFSLPPGNYDTILDIELMKMALAKGKKVIGLETVQEQYDVFDKMSLPDQVDLLAFTVKKYSLLTIQYESLFKAYLEQDLIKLQTIAKQQMDGDASQKVVLNKLMDRILSQRNNRMISRLQPLLQSKSCFIVVGALHLPGKEGLLNQLASTGFAVTAVEK